MNRNLFRTGALLFGAMVGSASLTLAATAKTDAAGPSAVVMTITATAKKDAQPPALTRNDLTLYQGRERVQVADMKRGDTLRLAVLIDDSLRSSVANQWSDLRAFMMAQPATTYIAVAYARNGTAMVAQDFTTDHALAAKAIRMPLGTLSVRLQSVSRASGLDQALAGSWRTQFRTSFFLGYRLFPRRPRIHRSRSRFHHRARAEEKHQYLVDLRARCRAPQPQLVCWLQLAIGFDPRLGSHGRPGLLSQSRHARNPEALLRRNRAESE